jgi:hypothetical protein
MGKVRQLWQPYSMSILAIALVSTRLASEGIADNTQQQPVSDREFGSAAAQPHWGALA